VDQSQYGFKSIDKRLAPVEFVFIGVLLYVLRDASHEDRARAIYTMRLNIREQFVDIRNNTKIGSALWTFINEVESNPHGSQQHSAGGSSSQAKNGKKRKKGADNEAEDEYRPSPVKSLGQTLKTRSKAPRTN